MNKKNTYRGIKLPPNERDLLIMDLYVNHPEMTMKEIAKTFNVSTGIVTKARIRCGIEPRRKKITKETKNRIIQDYKNQVTVDVISQKYEIDRTTVINYAKKAGCNMRINKNINWNKDKDKILDKYQSGKTLLQIALEYNSTTLVIRSGLKRCFPNIDFNFRRKKIHDDKIKREIIDLMLDFPELKRKEIQDITGHSTFIIGLARNSMTDKENLKLVNELIRIRAIAIKRLESIDSDIYKESVKKDKNEKKFEELIKSKIVHKKYLYALNKKISRYENMLVKKGIISEI